MSRLFLALFLAIASLATAKTLRDQNGIDLADCQCKCCSGEVQQQNVACDVDVVLLMSAAACVKPYMNQMKITAKRIVDDIYARQGVVGENGLNLIGNRVRIGIITYSSNANVVASLSSSLSASQLKNNMDSYSYATQGEGDMLSLGLKEAYNMFSAAGSGSRRALIIMTNGGTKEDVEVSTWTSKLRQSSVDIMVNTITEHCMVEKDCLMCCPEKKFLTSVLATSDRICDNQVISIDSGNSGMFDPEQDGNRRYGAGDYYKQCLDLLSYTCKGARTVVGETCNKDCECTCNQKRAGRMGVTGEPGKQGRMGVPGSAGKPGAPGHSGLPGMPGNPGAPGNPGQQCVAGQPAPDGRQGPHGLAGQNGEVGMNGKDGEQGLQGPPGFPGKQGQQGIQGKQGQKGPRGDEGECGSMGPTGAQGSPGNRGQPGDHGKNGNDGKPGAAGPIGQPGQTGHPGAVGDNGKNGDCGDIGAPGQDGKKGVPGVDGLDGRQGPSGPKGETGEQGLPGIQGQINYRQYVGIIVEEIHGYLSTYGWKFNCGCAEGEDCRPPVRTTQEPVRTTEPQPVEGCQVHGDAEPIEVSEEDLGLDINEPEMDIYEEYMELPEPSA